MKAEAILGYVVAPLAALGVVVYLLWPRKSSADVGRSGAQPASSTATAAAAAATGVPVDTTGVRPPPTITEDAAHGAHVCPVDKHGFYISPGYNQDEQNWYEGKKVKDIPNEYRQWFVNDMVAKFQAAASLPKGERLRKADYGTRKFIGPSITGQPYVTFLIRTAAENQPLLEQLMAGWNDPDHLVATYGIMIQDLGFWGDLANVIGKVTAVVKAVV